MEKHIRIAIAHRYKVLNDSLENMLNNIPDFRVIVTVDNGRAIADIVRKIPVDILIFDPFFDQKDGLDIAKETVALEKNIHLMVFLMESNWRYAYRFLRAGIRGCLTAEMGVSQLVEAIHHVYRGKVYLPESLQQDIVEYCVTPEDLDPEKILTDREFQVMRLIAGGRTNREVSEQLFIGVKTVDTHRANLLRKLYLRNNADLARFAMSHGYIQR